MLYGVNNGVAINNLLPCMNTSELIELWYTKFCIELVKPQPSFETFCILMKQNDFDFDQVMKYYKRRFLSD